MSSGNVIDSNIIQNIGSTNTGEGGIVGTFSFANSRITHNIVLNTRGPGIAILGGSTGEVQSNLFIDNNIVLNTNTNLNDTGGIYILDRGHLSNNVTISNNIIGNYGNQNADSKAIYLDDETSYVTVKNNIIYGTGQFGLQIHGGNNNVFTNNVFDLTQGQILGLYQDALTVGYPNFGMANNVFSNNIVYSSSSNTPFELWSYLDGTGGNIARPNVHNNLYYDAAHALPNSGAVVDSSATIANPLFVNAVTHNYVLQPGSPALGASVGFTSIDISAAGPLTH